MPVALHEMNDKVFIYSGLASLVTWFLFMRLLDLVSFKKTNKSRMRIVIGVLSVYFLLNIFYFTNIIPPVPLVMKNGGVYHNFSVSGGDYIVYGEPKSLWGIFDESPDFHRVSNEPVYVVTSVYAPNLLNTDIIHDWQYYDQISKKWISASKITVPIVGGRNGGYRFYSEKQSLTPGEWRVDVETTRGQIVGRIKFEIVDATSTPNLEQVTY